MLPLLFALACAGSPDDGATDGTTGGTTDGAASDGGASADAGATQAELNGQVPDEALPAPEFVATNRDDTGRSREDLLGHPTVMWFYPLAGTAG